jgi:GLPGLI family protein
VEKILLLSFLFLNLIVVNAQETKSDFVIFYSFKYKTSLNTNQVSNPEIYILYKSKNTSRFLNHNAYYNDSIRTNFDRTVKIDERKNPQKYLDFYSETAEKKLKAYTSDLRLMKDFGSNKAIIILYNTWRRHYMEETLSLDWEIQKEVKEIMGLNCIKAKTSYGGRTYIAWFTTEIPISDGPYIFHGLPGLIIKVTDSEGWYDFELKDLILKPTYRHVDEDFLEDQFTQKIDRKTYIKHSRKEKDDPKLMYGLPNPTPEMLLRLREKRKTRFDLIIEKQ